MFVEVAGSLPRRPNEVVQRASLAETLLVGLARPHVSSSSGLQWGVYFFFRCAAATEEGASLIMPSLVRSPS